MLFRDRVRILVADHDSTQLDTLCRGLFVCGHEASPARTVEDATALLVARGAGGFDLLLIDIRTPDDARIALLGVARAIAPSLPILVVTGLTDGARLAALRALGAPALVMPFTPDELDAAVRAAATRAADPR